MGVAWSLCLRAGMKCSHALVCVSACLSMYTCMLEVEVGAVGTCETMMSKFILYSFPISLSSHILLDHTCKVPIANLLLISRLPLVTTLNSHMS